MVLPILAVPPATVVRDSYGVPFIRAETAGTAWIAVGRSVAEDRWKQMDLSRRLARGKLAELLGDAYVKGDVEVLKTAYTDAELTAQFQKLPKDLQSAWQAYAVGVNEHRAKVAPDASPWTTLDSMAVMVRLLQQFGRGGGGELRNLAILGYLQNRKPIQGQTLEALDDIAWQTDVDAVPTAAMRFTSESVFPAFTRADTDRQIAALPKLSLFELLPLIQLAQRETSTRIAENLNLPFKTGSYAVVVPGSRSTTGEPLLLSGPQMGFRNPSVVHLIGMKAPGLEVQGMDVPGVPGVMVGTNRNVAWGLTSGVSDLEDVMFDPNPKIESLSLTVAVKDGEGGQAVRERTKDGLVLWKKDKVGAFVLARSYEGDEWQSYRSLSRLWTARDGGAAERAVADATMSFNFFWADKSGAGYRHLGRVPIRKGGDPRLPMVGTRATLWGGFLPYVKMPQQRATTAPISNWNNLPAQGWPNGDTPVWGEGFRVRTLNEALKREKLSEEDLIAAAKSISIADEDWPTFRGYHKDGMLAEWDGMRLAGSEKPGQFRAWLANIRKELFQEKLGDFLTPEYAALIFSTSLVQHALKKQTSLDYLAGRDVTAVLAKSKEGLTGKPFVPPPIPVTGGEPIPYSNRGTYIQVMRISRKGSVGRNVAPPGIAEDGPHRIDMADLSRNWSFRSMVPWD
ncbi:hypothetical protein EON81_15240 [bacterium]|nr:MAG: hypothetical protein EON81_15240 [bacterium]